MGRYEKTVQGDTWSNNLLATPALPIPMTKKFAIGENAFESCIQAGLMAMDVNRSLRGSNQSSELDVSSFGAWPYAAMPFWVNPAKIGDLRQKVLHVYSCVRGPI